MEKASNLIDRPDTAPTVPDAAAPATTNLKLIEEDGMTYDPETGEIVDREASPPVASEKGDVPIVDRDFVDLQMRRIQNADAKVSTMTSLVNSLDHDLTVRIDELSGRDPECLVLRRRIDNLKSQAKEASARATFLRAAYGPALRAFVQYVTAGVKSRTFKSPKGYGSISLRAISAKIEIVDETKAISTARSLNWDGAVIETFVASAIPDDVMTEILKTPDSAAAFGLAVKPGEDREYIKS